MFARVSQIFSLPFISIFPTIPTTIAISRNNPGCLPLMASQSFQKNFKYVYPVLKSPYLKSYQIFSQTLLGFLSALTRHLCRVPDCTSDEPFSFCACSVFEYPLGLRTTAPLLQPKYRTQGIYCQSSQNAGTYNLCGTCFAV